MPRKRYDARLAWDVIFVAMGWATVVTAGVEDLAAATATAAVTPRRRARSVDGWLLTPRQVVEHFRKVGVQVGRRYVINCMRRYLLGGDPSYKQDSQRVSHLAANSQQRQWLKNQLQYDPSLYFFELARKFQTKFRRTISDEMISKALHYDGGPGDRPLSLKVVQKLARQRCEIKRMECWLALRGLWPECLIIIDESHVADSDFRRRRGWAPVGEPAQVHHHLLFPRCQLSSLSCVCRSTNISAATGCYARSSLR